ncbi:MAG: 16S rRNA (guanine(966)-N(2))-methyltransferase RsmD [Candidatus Sumerlaeia bacterium]|nr:16S rRNA (guanine(966)-N(2))-methyltransferase RsmD [Candidatus Sumerlaeia bacterium]
MTLRIIGGCRRGAHLHSPPGMDTRPLRDRVRESLFNILAPRLSGAVVLDAFAGSGAVGLEAVSRGAAHAVLVDSGADAAETIRRNIAKLRFEDRAAVLRGAVPEALAKLPRTPGAFDLLFLMPPYHSALSDPVLASAHLAPRLAATALAVVEVHRDEPDPNVDPATWVLEDERAYGVTRLRFYRRQAATSTTP